MCLIRTNLTINFLSNLSSSSTSPVCDLSVWKDLLIWVTSDFKSSWMLLLSQAFHHHSNSWNKTKELYISWEPWPPPCAVSTASRCGHCFSMFRSSTWWQTRTLYVFCHWQLCLEWGLMFIRRLSTGQSFAHQLQGAKCTQNVYFHEFSWFVLTLYKYKNWCKLE